MTFLSDIMSATIKLYLWAPHVYTRRSSVITMLAVVTLIVSVYHVVSASQNMSKHRYR